MSNHTKGPWEIDTRIRTAINCGKKHVAMVGFYKVSDKTQCIDIDEHEANANLIAATPEMYDVLLKLWDYYAKSDSAHMLPITLMIEVKEILGKIEGSND